MKKIRLQQERYEFSPLKKLLLMAKLTALLILISIMQISANVHAQAGKLDLKVKNVSILQVFEEIEDNSEYRFFYDNDQVDLSKKVSINTKQEELTTILKEIFAGTDLTYEVKAPLILVKSKNPVVNTDVFSQQKSISGKVFDEFNQPLPGVTVLIKGTTNGTVTNMDGNYSITNITENATLIFSFVGMKTQEVEVGNQTIINVTLSEETRGIEEVVAIGYGTQKKATVTGSITTVAGEQLQASQSTNFANALAGQLPGLVAVSRSGLPGDDDPILRVRGSNTLGDNSPLIVVDGIAGRSLQGLNSMDIESLTVLKDASAAIYGAQAANGVILVTTKRGSTGKPSISVSLNQGFSAPTVLPKMADAPTYAQMVNELQGYRDRLEKYSEAEIQKFKDGSDPWGYPNTDWVDEVYKKHSIQNSVNVSLNGGTNSFTYLVSLGHKYQDGSQKGGATNYGQTNFRSNLDAKVSDNIKLSIDVAGRQENRNYPGRGAGLGSVVSAFPTSQAYWPNGLPGPDVERGDNPVVTVTDATGYNKNKRYVLESNMKLAITIPWIKGLSLSGTASIDKSFSISKLWQQPWDLYSWDKVTYDANNIPLLSKASKGVSDPSLRQTYRGGNSTTFNALLNYDRTFGEHNVKFLAGVERREGDYMEFWAYRRYFVSTSAQELFAGGEEEKDNNGSGGADARLNYFGRVNYNFSQKYMAEFVWRYDGSYKFPADNRFGFFPGVSLGWRISEEPFWNENINFLNYFKIRGYWGQTGNDRIEEYQYLASYGFGNPYFFNNGSEIKTLDELRVPNANITWEIANQTNIGFDTQLFEDHLSLSADYFYNLRTNILWWRNASVPATTGLNLPRENIGEVENQGFEFDVSYNNKIRDFSYKISVNAAIQKNRIKFWDETPGIPEYQRSTGMPMNARLFYHAIGIFKDQPAVDAYPHWANARPGDIIFEDVNKDEKIDGLDQVRNDKTDLPTLTGGLNINLVPYLLF